MNQQHATALVEDQHLWQMISQQLHTMPEKQRKEWEPLLECLQERDRMTAQALKLAESGLKMMAKNIQKMENEKSRVNRLFQPAIGPSGDNHWRVDPQPGSGGCMWMS